MGKNGILYFIVFAFLAGCTTEPEKIVIHGKINGGAGKFIKVIDMTQPGLKPDSIQLDMGSNFTYERITKVPKDLIFYFDAKNHIRITPLVNETVQLQAKASDLVQTYRIQGSDESKKVQQIIQRTHASAHVIDTLNAFYMKNQLNPDLDTIVAHLIALSDSVYKTDKLFFEHFIKSNPASLASYVALSQKLDDNKPYFRISDDLYYFEMVDTALFNRYDTIPMVKMLHAYVMQAKAKFRNQQNMKKNGLSIGSMAPDIHLPNIYGDTLHLSDLRGKYVLVDFWGSWCRPCRKENKNLRTAYRKYRYFGFEIFQVAIERSKADWKNTIREDRLYWRYQVSELNYMQSQTARNFGVQKIPSNFLLDSQGKVIAINLYGEKLLTTLDEIFYPKTVTQVQTETRGQ